MGDGAVGGGGGGRLGVVGGEGGGRWGRGVIVGNGTGRGRAGKQMELKGFWFSGKTQPTLSFFLVSDEACLASALFPVLSGVFLFFSETAFPLISTLHRVFLGFFHFFIFFSSFFLHVVNRLSFLSNLCVFSPHNAGCITILSSDS